MRKILYLVMAMMFVTLLALPIAAMAEAEPGEIIPITWAYVGTIAGATAVTLVVVQFLKVPLDKVWKIPTRFFVYGIAVALMVLAKAFTSGIIIDDVPLILANAFVVATSAYGAYEITFKKLE